MGHPGINSTCVCWTLLSLIEMSHGTQLKRNNNMTELITGLRYRQKKRYRQMSIATSSYWGSEMCLVLLIYDVTFFSSLQGVLLGPVEKNGLKRVGNTSLSMYLSHLSHLCHPLKRSCSSQFNFCRM